MLRLCLLTFTLFLWGCATSEFASQTQPSEVTTRSDKGPGDRMPSGRDLGTRSAIVAPNAAAATAHPLATQIALDVMKKGGSAMDAAIAANAMLGLVEPTGNGIGGDLFAMVWDPKTQKLYGYNGSGRSPMGATLQDMQAKSEAINDGKGIPPLGAAPVTVPGTVDGWFALHQKFGKRPMLENLAPTINYARTGAPIPEVIAYYWGRNETRLNAAYESGMLEEFDNAKKTYFSPTPVEGSLFTSPDLANTLEAIGKGGRDAFYKGKIAKTIDSYMNRIGGFLTYEDMATHKGEWVEPLCVPYRDVVKLCELPPNTQGVAALQMLQMLERFDLRGMGWGSADALMAQVEAKRLAFADRASSYADPDFSELPPEVLLRNERIGAMLDSIDLRQSAKHAAKGGLRMNKNGTLFSQHIDYFVGLGGNAFKQGLECKAESKNADIMCYPMLEQGPIISLADKKLQDGDTTYLTVADESGMMVSLIQSNYRGMGSGLVPDGLGFMLQDRGELFSLDPEHPNVFEPGKRPFHTIIPGFAFKKDMPDCQVASIPMDQACPYLPWLSFGLMGGAMQPQGHVQIILNLIDFDMGLQEAGDAARWEHRGGCEPTDDLDGDPCEEDIGVVWLESGIPEATRQELEKRGHAVKCCQANGGGYQAVMRDFQSGAWIAATEMRKDGSADGF